MTSYGALAEYPLGREALFYTLKNKHVIKMGWTAWRGLCRLTITNTALPECVFRNYKL